MKLNYTFLVVLLTLFASAQLPNSGHEGFETATQPLSTSNPTFWALSSSLPGSPWLILDNGVGTTNRWSLFNQVSVAHTGNKAIFCSPENIGAGSTSMDYLVTPPTLVPSNGMLKFFIRSSVQGDQGTVFSIKAAFPVGNTSPTDTAAYTINLATFSETNLNSVPNLYQEITVDLSAFTGQLLSFAFVMEVTQVGADTYGDTLLLDDIRVISDVCQSPHRPLITAQDMTSITLDWAELGNATIWELYAVPCGSAAPTTTSFGVFLTTHPYVVTGLSPGTCYEFYVRSVCATGPSTPWVPFAFQANTLPNSLYCGMVLTDNGGSSNPYLPNTNYVVTLCPSVINGRMGVSFSQFNTEPGVDILRIYEGNSIGGTLIGQYSGSFLPPTIFSTEPEGCLTLEFQTNGTVNLDGWVATVLCAGGDSIKMNTFLDTNADGIQNGSEPHFPHGAFAYSLNGGPTQNLSFFNSNTIYDNTTSSSYDITYTVEPTYQSYFSPATSSISNVNPSFPETSISIPIVSTQSFNDVRILCTPLAIPRPGFPFTVLLTIQNNSYQVQSGTILFTKGSGVISLTTDNPLSILTAQGFSCAFSNLGPFSQQQLVVNMVLDVLPNVFLGQLLTHTASVTGLGTDDVPANNTTSLTQVVLGAYDPNFVVEHHGPDILYSSFSTNDSLEYTIHFQNEGNFYAENVRIENLLDNQLDAGSLELLASSHPCRLVREGSQLRFYFDTIFLQPKSVSEEASQGFVTFKIKPNPGYQVGTIIPKGAEIYFDFNPPIYTNVFQTQFVNTLAVGSVTTPSFLLYPNPTNTDVYLKLTLMLKDQAKVEVFNQLGEVLYQIDVAGEQLTIPLHPLPRGVYFIRLRSAYGSSVRKVVKW